MASPYDLVRVSDPHSGAHVTVTRATADAAGLTPLKSEATDRYGVALAAKPRTDKTGAPTKAATSEKKENA